MAARKSPKYSIVIPCYNEGRYIGRTLESLQKQTLTNFEVIVVDNDSSDDTAEQARKRGARVVEEKRRGVCWARQSGTEAARGEIIVSTDADSTFNSDWLQLIDDQFGKSPDVVAVTGPFYYEGGPSWARYARALFKFVGIFYKLTGRVLYAPGANTSFKKSVWDGYNTTMTQYGDEIDLLRKLKRKGKVVFTPETAVDTSPRRLHGGFFYNVVVSFLMYSFLEYNLNRLFKRQIFGPAPAFREEDGAMKKHKIRKPRHDRRTKQPNSVK